jgi:hypothetical protein
MLQFFRVAVEGRDSGNVCLFTRGGGTVGLLGFVDFVKTALDYFAIRLIPELVPQAHRNAPVRHDAVGIFDCDLNKFFLSFFVPEGVQQGDTALEGLAHARGTGYREIHRAQLRRSEILMVMGLIIASLIIVSDGGGGKSAKQKHAANN